MHPTMLRNANFSLPTRKDSTQKITPLRRSPARRMTRAHLAVLSRPYLSRDGALMLAQISERLSELLGAEIRIEGRLAKSAVLPMEGLSRFTSFALFELAHFAQPVVVELERRILGTLLESISGEASVPGPLLGLTQVEQAALGWVLLETLAVTRTDSMVQRCFGPRLLGLFDQRGDVLERIDGRVRHLAIELTVFVGGQSGSCRLLIPGRVAQAALQELPPEPPRPLHSSIADAQLTLIPFAGHAVLSAREADELQEKDVVLLDGLNRVDGRLSGPLRLVASGFELHGTLDGGVFTLSQLVTTALSKEESMTKEAQTDLLPALPVEVEVELTRINLRVGELATLRPGAVIPLRLSPVDPVTLRIGDRIIGKAELVEIDGELGARIIGMGSER
jgi:type III secretion protein Q